MRALACGGAIAMMGAFYAHGGGNGETYALSPAQAQSRLTAMHVPADLRTITEALPGGSIGREDKDGKSVWTFYARGHRAASFTAELHSVDDGHTRIDTDFDMASDADTVLTDRTLSLAKPFEALGRTGMTEQLDATMERRPFDRKVMGRAVANYVLTHAGEIQAAVGQAMEAAIARERATGDDPMRLDYKPGEPMLDPTPLADRHDDD